MEPKSTPSPTQKTKIDQVIDRLFAYLQRQWRLLALFILYIFFHPTFESKLVALLQPFEPSWGSFIVWCGIIVTALTYTYILCQRRYVISEGVLFGTILLLVGWAYYRFIDTDYIAIPTPIPGVCYVDLLPILGSCVVLVAGRSHWNRTKHKQEGAVESRLGYAVECPCAPEDKDLLKRREEAKDLAEKIFQTNTSNAAFTLGIIAPWGAGKTSFMLSMKDYLEKHHSDRVILVDFNPWMYRKSPNLTQIFFEELSRTLAPYNSALASGFTRYVDHILDKDDSAWLRLGVRLLSQGFKAKSTSEQYEFLEKEIGKLGKKIMIFIDDVDRLDSEELIELFSLIRNSSLSFPYMSYILTYDKEYVASQLQSEFNEHTYRYMEKIVQAEYPLAKITPEQLEEAFTKELVNMSPTYNRLATHIISSIQLENYLTTLRAIKQICNALSSRRKELEGNVSLFDWFIIELIRIQYPRLFDFLRENYRRVFYAQGDKRSIRIEEALADHPSYGSEIDFCKHISEHHKSLQIKSVGLVTELLLLLWGEARDAEVLQANHGDYIGRYFYGTLCASEIDETEFQKHIALPFEEIKEYVKQKINLMQEQDLYHKIKREHADSREKAEKLLRTVFYLASSRLLFTRTDFDDQVNQLNRYLNWEDRKSKLMEIFEQPDIQLGVLLYLIMATRYIEDPSFDSYTGEELSILPFSSEELEEKKVSLFMKYLTEHKSRNLGFCYILWRECRTFKSTGQQDRWGKLLLKPVVRHPQMDKEMKQAIQENLEAVIPYFIAPYIAPFRPPQKNVYMLLLPEPIWGIYPDESFENESFCDFINRQDGDSSRVIKEFQEFLKRWIENKDRAQFYNEDEDPVVVGFRFNHIEPKGRESLFRNENCKPRNYPEDESTEMY
ncbi:KAP family P-loop NTPase fold protein [Porphyromonas sp.]